ncbi:MAG: AAA family ATPase [Bacteroidetes bacterium]|jgi:replicative DNA helicase|nr:AAA family ATPase [Bacteroidota bacterium]
MNRPFDITDKRRNGRSAPLPEKYAAERDVLGACLLDVQCCARAIELLRPDCFADRTHGHAALFEIIERLFAEGAPVNMVTVSDVGFEDAAYLADLTSQATAIPVQTERMARVVLEQHIARQCYVSWQRGLSRLKADEDVFEVMDDVHEETLSVRLGGSTNTHISNAIGEAMERTERWQQGERADMVPTGFYSLDRMLGGYAVGELTTVAAMTGAGKTSLLIHIAAAQAERLAKAQASGKDSGAVLLFSAEMTAEQLVHRMAAARGQTDLRQLRGGQAQHDHYEHHLDALSELTRLEIHIDDDPQPTWSRIQARCQQLQATSGLAFVGVDYDEKIQSQGRTEELRVSEIAQGLKRLAKRFQVPVLALSQYSRKATAFSWPDNDWLRYSGKKEHESAMILHWVWPDYWKQRGVDPYDSDGSVRIAGYLEGRPEAGYLFCTKNRFGSLGKALIKFFPQHTRFVDPNEPSPF